jgi:hypothetical protein
VKVVLLTEFQALDRSLNFNLELNLLALSVAVGQTVDYAGQPDVQFRQHVFKQTNAHGVSLR